MEARGELVPGRSRRAATCRWRCWRGEKTCAEVGAPAERLRPGRADLVETQRPRSLPSPATEAAGARVRGSGMGEGPSTARPYLEYPSSGLASGPLELCRRAFRRGAGAAQAGGPLGPRTGLENTLPLGRVCREQTCVPVSMG